MKIHTKPEASCTAAVQLMLVTLQQMMIKNLKCWCEEMNCHLLCVVYTLIHSFLKGTAGVGNFLFGLVCMSANYLHILIIEWVNDSY